MSDALFEQKRLSIDNLTHGTFWTKGELFYKKLLKRSVLKLKFQKPENLDEKNWIFPDSHRKQLQIYDWTKK